MVCCWLTVGQWRWKGLRGCARCRRGAIGRKHVCCCLPMLGLFRSRREALDHPYLDFSLDVLPCRRHHQHFISARS